MRNPFYVPTRRNGRPPRIMMLEREITDEDWDKILGPLKEALGPVRGKFLLREQRVFVLASLWKGVNNQPLSTGEALDRFTLEEKKLVCGYTDGRFYLTPADLTAPTTSYFNEHNLPYRIRVVRRDSTQSYHALRVFAKRDQAPT